MLLQKPCSEYSVVSAELDKQWWLSVNSQSRIYHIRLRSVTSGESVFVMATRQRPYALVHRTLSGGLLDDHVIYLLLNRLFMQYPDVILDILIDH